MSNKFLDRFKEVCAEIDKVVKVAPESEQPVSEIVRYNIHRRSLPVGLDKPVAFFLTKDEAAIMIKTLKAKTLDNGHVIYYDAVPNTGRDAGVFPRGGQIVIQRGFTCVEEPKEERPVDLPWVG